MSGFSALSLVAHLFQMPVQGEGLKEEFGTDDPSDPVPLQRAAKSIGLKYKAITLSIKKLPKTPLPAIALTQSGEWVVLAKVKTEAREQAPTDKDKSESSTSASDNVSDHDHQVKCLVQRADVAQPEIWDQAQLEAELTGTAILLSKEKGLIETLQASFDIRWFIPAFMKYRKLFGEILIASLFIQFFALLTPLFFQVVMDKVLVHQGFSTLDVLAVAFFAAAIFEVVLGGVRQYLLSHTSNRVDVELGAKLYQHLLKLPIEFFSSRSIGQVVARVRELDSIRQFITSSALTLCVDLLFMFVFFAFLWYYSPTLVWVVVGTIPLYIVLSIIVTPILKSRLDEQFKYSAENQAFLTESISGIKTLKAMAIEPQMQRKWEDRLAHYVTAAFRVNHLGNVSGQIAQFINKAMTIAIIWFGAHQVMEGNMTVGQLVAFNMIAGRVSGPLLKLVSLWQEFQQMGLSVRRLGDILNVTPEPGFDPSRGQLPDMKGEIQFEQVNFRYSVEGRRILNDIQLKIHAGESIGIVGPSGSGKSTLSQLVQRMYVPESGRVMIDGVDLSLVDTRWLRQQIGVVPQESFLFKGSVRDNIALTNPAAPMEAIMAAAKLAGAHDFILELSQAYDTPLEENGGGLSGGQKQRIAIARALLTHPKILILDEATSALDVESEHRIQENMSQISQGRTVMIIAHRLSTVRDCDRILVMDQGRIIEQGSYEELVHLGGVFAGMHERQHPSIGQPDDKAQTNPKPASKDQVVAHTQKAAQSQTAAPKEAANASGPQLKASFTIGGQS